MRDLERQVRAAVNENNTAEALRLLATVPKDSTLVKGYYNEDRSWQPALIIKAAEHDNVEVVKALLNINASQIFILATDRIFLLEKLAGEGKTAIIQAMMSYLPLDGCDITSSYHEYYETRNSAILRAASNKHWDTVFAIIQALSPKSGKASPLLRGRKDVMTAHLMTILPQIIEAEQLEAIDALLAVLEEEAAKASNDYLNLIRGMKAAIEKGYSDHFLRLLNLSPKFAFFNSLGYQTTQTSMIEMLATSGLWSTLQLTLTEPYLNKIRHDSNFKRVYAEVLKEAVKGDEIGLVKRLLELGVFSTDAFNAAAKKENKALFNLFLNPEYFVTHQLAQDGNIDALSIAITHNPSLLTRSNAEGKKPLHLAAANGNLECTRLILNVLSRDLPDELSEHTAVLFTSIPTHRNSLTALLIEHRVGLDYQDESSGDYAIHLAAKIGDKAPIKALLKKDPSLIAQKNRSSLDPLRVAAASGKSEIFVEAYIEVLDSYAEEPMQRSIALQQLKKCIAQLEPSADPAPYFDLLGKLEAHEFIRLVEGHAGLLISTFSSTQINHIDSETLIDFIKTIFDSESPHYAKRVDQLEQIKNSIAKHSGSLMALLAHLSNPSIDRSEKAKLTPLAEVLADYLISLDDKEFLTETLDGRKSLGEFFAAHSRLIEKFRDILNPPSAAAVSPAAPKSLTQIRAEAAAAAVAATSTQTSFGFAGMFSGGSRRTTTVVAGAGAGATQVDASILTSSAPGANSTRKGIN